MISVLIVVLGACAPKHVEREAERPIEPLEDTPLAETETEPEPGPVQVSTFHAARFRTLARDLPEYEADPRHRAEVQALEILAGALFDLDARYPGLADEGQRVNAMAALITDSEPTSLMHADWTRAALLSAVDALDDVAAARPDLPMLPDRVRWAREAASAIEPGRAMLAQRGDVALAFSRLADALVMAAEVPLEVGAR